MILPIPIMMPRVSATPVVIRRHIEHEGTHAKYDRKCNATMNAAMAAAISAGKSPEDAVAIGKQAAFAAHGEYIADCADPDQPIENPDR